tara:strand:- start:39 stop:230 length:192 start_codon:yes stop_codon:yes gene_type:complete
MDEEDIKQRRPIVRLIGEIEQWIERAKKQGMDKYVEAYEHVLVMIDRVYVPLAAEILAREKNE